MFLRAGRFGIAHALLAHRIGAGDEVLLPAYHCPAMVEPVAWCGATPRFYRIGADTGADLNDIVAKCGPRTRTILAAHFFGFPQDMHALRAICDERGLLLIEDCAHAFFGRFDGQPPGSQGDYAIASPMKFFPIYDGGLLVSRRHSLSAIRLRHGGIAFQAKSAFNILERAISYSRLRPLGPPLQAVFGIRKLWQRRRKRSVADGALLPPSLDANWTYRFDPLSLDMRVSRPSRLLIELSNQHRITARRRANYEYLRAAFRELPGATPLFAELPQGVVPYMFPLRLHQANRLYPALKRMGVPLLRFSDDHWPGVDASVCPVAADLAQNVVQIPCHQELRPSEIDWIIARLREAIAMNSN